jgi:tRNA-specific 2-thiouridylase
LGVSAPHPLYVLEINDGSKRVVVGRKEELGRPGFFAHPVNWIEPPDGAEIAAEVQLRYRSAVVPCLLHLDEKPSGAGVRVEFLASSQPVTPGQAAVFYQGERVLGGGWIIQALDENRSENAGL